MTLQDLWEQKGFSPTQLAAQAGITVNTLYRMNRKESVRGTTIASVCRVLEITRKEYDKLEQG